MRKFVLGILTIIAFIPICESVTEIILGWLETFKVANTLNVMKGNQKIEKLQSELDGGENTYCMGFDLSPQEDDEYYDDDCDDDCDCKKKKNRIGF